MSFVSIRRGGKPPSQEKAAARAAGLKTYVTGIPCVNGHVCPRWVSCGSCVQCQQVAKQKLKLKGWGRDYARGWRARNPDKVRAYTAKWRRKNPRAGAAYMARRRKIAGDVLRAQERTRYAANPKRHLDKTRAYFQANPGHMAAYASRRRARKRAADGWHTGGEVSALLRRQHFRCANCATSIRRGYHADHIMPLSLGGSDWISNIQLLCPVCNMKKGPKHPIEFARLQGRLV